MRVEVTVRWEGGSSTRMEKMPHTCVHDPWSIPQLPPEQSYCRAMTNEDRLWGSDGGQADDEGAILPCTARGVTSTGQVETGQHWTKARALGKNRAPEKIDKGIPWQVTAV